MSLKNYNIPIDVIQYVICRFISYFELDAILHCFKLTPKEIALVKFKIYNQRRTVTRGKYRIEYRVENKLHREGDLLAVLHVSGRKEWYLNDKRHRIGGPAVEWPRGSTSWFMHGELHREDGPAIEWEGGSREWWINGKNIV